jgi:hypothetical protein
MEAVGTTAGQKLHQRCSQCDAQLLHAVQHTSSGGAAGRSINSLSLTKRQTQTNTPMTALLCPSWPACRLTYGSVACTTAALPLVPLLCCS